MNARLTHRIGHPVGSPGTQLAEARPGGTAQIGLRTGLDVVRPQHVVLVVLGVLQQGGQRSYTTRNKASFQGSLPDFLSRMDRTDRRKMAQPMLRRPSSARPSHLSNEQGVQLGNEGNVVRVGNAIQSAGVGGVSCRGARHVPGNAM